MRHLERDARRLLRSLEPSKEQWVIAAVCGLLTEFEAEADGGSIRAIYRSALARHGESLRKAGGTEAMRAALDTVCAARPERSDERRAMITAAWAALMETKL